MSVPATSSQLDEFAAGYGFTLDPFQLEACAALESGNSVLVAAPTGAGKTVVGEFAVHLALTVGQKCFYTTPIKALSNQKYNDLVARHGERSVGLLTGDNSVNGEAPVVVMTTEVLRNMIYAQSTTLRGLGYVVMDEVHYLADRFRGAVWEEVIIHLPDSVRLVSLSATVSNAEEFADWLVTVRGHTTVVVDEHRPVPLWQHMLVGSRLYDLFVEDEVNPDLVRFAQEQQRLERKLPTRPGRGMRRPRRVYLPSRMEVVDRLDTDGLLPAIYFIFSRAGCDAAVTQCVRAGLRMTTYDERMRIREYAEARCNPIEDDDLAALGYAEWLDALERGIAAHHAGLLPTFKEVIEHLFARGLVKAVFATETLALGINMPARSVVLERLMKWNGEAHVDVTPGEYTQLTGRAGRRGIDVEGHAIVLWAPDIDPLEVASLAGTRTYPLVSSFRPSYNMAVNLVATVGRQRARALLEASFAQFQADRAVVGLARQVQRNDEALAGYREAMTCDLGDFFEYARLRQQIAEREAALARDAATARRAAALQSLEKLHIGDVIAVPAGRRRGMAVVLDAGLGGEDGPRPLVLTADRQVRRLSHTDFPVPVEALAKVRVPRHFNTRSPKSRRDLASALRDKTTDISMPPAPGRARSTAADDAEIHRLRRVLREHPCHTCPDREEHARWAERYFRLDRDTEGLRRRVRNRTNTIARTFDRVCGLLTDLGYLDGERVTDRGRVLARVYTELDLLVVECLNRELWDTLTPPELAACVSALVYEARQPDGSRPRIPGGAVRTTLAEMVHAWGDLSAREEEHRLSFLREPDVGFAWAAHRWASGATLDRVLTETGMAAGDFVRWTKQLIDLMAQIADAARDSPAGATARVTLRSLQRGVVAYSAVA